MKTKLLVLVPWMALTGSAVAQVRSADVLYLHQETVPQPAFRLGDECFVPIENAETWGWKISPTASEAKVEVDGKTITIPIRSVNNRRTLPLRKAITLLGGESEWQSANDTLSVYSVLNELSVKSFQLEAKAPLPIKPFTFYLTDPGRTMVDLVGVRLKSSTKLSLPVGAKAFQYRTNVVRISFPTPFVPELPKDLLKPSREIVLEAKRSADVETVLKPEKAPEPAAVVPQSSGVSGILPIMVNADTKTTTSIGLNFDQVISGVTFRKSDPGTLQVVIPGTAFTLPAEFKLGTEAVEKTEVTQEGESTLLTLHLTRAMGAELSRDGSKFVINLFKPNVGDGKLAGKIITIDPGHGGKFTGAPGGGLLEKNMTLAVGKIVAQRLAEAGATVILTRKTDTQLSYDLGTDLLMRNEIAIKAKSDLFISFHINSMDNSTSNGTMTFYHSGDGVSKLLGECIQTEIVRVSKLRGGGVHQDTSLHKSGLSVLRNAHMPAVLVELGFISNATDRKRMNSQEFREAVGQAVVRALRVYLGDKNSHE